MSNPSTIYANIFVDELIHAGLKHVCFVPGSRHTPLILAFARHKDEIKIYSHLDERSAAFFALGLAMALDEPVAMVCTSGSAGANFFPAIVEAHQSRVPLIVLTADRPPELRHSGANQTIDQIKMFGDFVLWFVDAALPEENPSALVLRNLRTLAARAVAKANGIRKGVVHINMPFRKPLEPDTEDHDWKIPTGAHARSMTAPYTFAGNGYLKAFSSQIEYLSGIVDQRDAGIIICGTRCDHSIVVAAGHLAEKTNFPVFVDPISNARFHDYSKLTPYMISSYETFLSKDHLHSPSLIIQFGDVPTSKWLNSYIVSEEDKQYGRKHIHLASHGDWSDDSHTVADFFQLPEVQTSIDIMQNIKQKDDSWFSPFKSIEKTTWEIIDHELNTGAYFDGGVVYDVVDLIPDESTLFAGNSLPVRHLDQFGKPTNKRIFAYANRGASGIDGNISTALGTGAARPDKPLVAIVGDITFYHDMNGLLAVHRCGVPVTIVLLNNDGGGIFHRLPVNKFDPDFTDYFITAHGLDYSHTAKLYGLDYVRVQGRDEFRQAFSESVNGRTSTIIEFQSDAQQDLKRRNEIVAAVHARLKELNL